MIVGAILAGGQSRRFGSDKAAALLRERPLLEHVRAALAPQVDRVIVVGRAWPGLNRVDDQPRGQLGPLGGILGALGWAHASGFDAVLTVPCDCPTLPDRLTALLSPASSYLADSPVIGLWRPELAPDLSTFLSGDGSRSVRRWAALAGARAVELEARIANLNTPDDLDALRRQAGP